MIVAGVLCAATLVLLAPTVDAAKKIDVFIYTDTVQWIGQAQAKEHAETLAKKIDGQQGFGEVIVHGPAKQVEAWTKDHTVDKGNHIIVMFGDVPVEIYDVGKDAKKETVAEEYLDAGNSYSNSADYFFLGTGR